MLVTNMLRISNLLGVRNGTTENHPCSDPDLAATFIQKSCELAEYWKLRTDLSYEPMSLEDAIWGNNTVQPMDLDTSTGAAFQMLFPGKPRSSMYLVIEGNLLVKQECG